MPRSKGKDIETKMISSFSLIKQLQGKIPVKSISEITGISPSTVHRFFHCDTFHDYEIFRAKHNEEVKAKRRHDIVFKATPEVVETPQIDIAIPSKTNDISKMGEITTMSLLNAILGELKKLNSFLEENK